MTIYEIIGVLSALVFVTGDIPYFRDTIKGVTQPHRVTWGVVTLLNAINFANQLASDASSSLPLFAIAPIATGLIFLASFKYGVGGHSRSDVLTVVVALLGVLLWVIFDAPVISIILNIATINVALAPTFIKTYRNPGSETGLAWLFGTASAVLGGISVGALDPILLALPVNGFIVQGIMVYLIYIRGGKKPTNAAST